MDVVKGMVMLTSPFWGLFVVAGGYNLWVWMKGDR